MKKSAVLFSSLIVIVGISAFSLIEDSSGNCANLSTAQEDSSNATIELAQFGINGGLDINTRTGKVNEFLANNKQPDLIYMVRGYNESGIRRPITRQKLMQAKSIADIIENYPENWIKIIILL